ncbi:MAG: hypothetical protein ACLR6J_15340 [Parabacteroides merdae]
MKETCPRTSMSFINIKISSLKIRAADAVSTYYLKSPIPCLSFFPKVLPWVSDKGLTNMKSVLTDLYICSIFTGST